MKVLGLHDVFNFKSISMEFLGLRNMKNLIFAFFAISVMFSSCAINKDFILRTDEDFKFATAPVDSLGGAFRLAPNAFISFDLYTNEGAVVLESATSDGQRIPLTRMNQNFYAIEQDGYCELPVIGRQYIAGMTIEECQNFLEEKFSVQFIKPFALVRVINRRCLVYNGKRSEGIVVPLENPNVTLIEALSLIGGLAESANAEKVRVIRNVDGKAEVFKFDLSKIENLSQAYFVIQHGDIIHVEPMPRLALEVQKNVLPYVQLVSSIAIIVGVLTRII
jgi:polysaccharide biosynthesis/export protein